MRLGFVLDQRACIGCHACTVACKAENDVALGSFRTWVKWVEHGEFPTIEKSAAVLRCNHCADAPCIEICPTIALYKRADGIVDLDRDRCIGCASCMQACPYDAIHIDDRHGTAAKCHFCAHRVEVDLAPACVAVCPEQAIKVVDLDDSETRSELGGLGAVARKPERKTRPQTWYLGADPAALDPLAVDGTRTLSHAEVPDPLPAPGTAEARAAYDIPKARPWGSRIAAYMVTKAFASGSLFAAALNPWFATIDDQLLGWVSFLLVVLTTGLLIADLHKPSRFLYVLTKPNPRSWLVRGGWILTAHALISLLWALGLAGLAWAVPTLLVSLMSSVYTAFLFRQARGRELWSEDRLLPWVLGAQTLAAAAAFGWAFGVRGVWVIAPLALYSALALGSLLVAPPTAHARAAHHLMKRHWAAWVGIGSAVLSIFLPPILLMAFSCLDWVTVDAGQKVPLS